MAGKIVNKKMIDIDFKKSRPLYVTKQPNYGLNKGELLITTAKSISVTITEGFVKFIFYDGCSDGRNTRSVMYFDLEDEYIGYNLLDYILFNEAKNNLEFENNIRSILS